MRQIRGLWKLFELDILLAVASRQIIREDIVQDTALESLQYMDNISESRPTKYRAFDQALDWTNNYKKCKDHASVKEGLETQLVQNSNVEFTWRYDVTQSKPYWDGRAYFVSSFSTKPIRLVSQFEPELLDVEIK